MEKYFMKCKKSSVESLNVGSSSVPNPSPNVVVRDNVVRDNVIRDDANRDDLVGDVVSDEVVQDVVVSDEVVQDVVVRDSVNRVVIEDDVRRGKRARMENTCEWEIISDPALRKPINEFDPLVRDDVLREYVLKGPCQPLLHDFPKTAFGRKMRCFQKGWFKDRDWLEYSVSADAAYCFWCYLFKGDCKRNVGDGVFVKNGFRNWNKGPKRLKDHVGTTGSQHNDAKTSFFGYKDQRQSVTRSLSVGNKVQSAEYRVRLTASLDVARFLLHQALPFRGNDESLFSPNKGNFKEFLSWYGMRKEEVGKIVLGNAPANLQLTSHQIQKELCCACAAETTKVILSELGDKFFSLLVDEARDVSVKEQMALVVRYVNNKGGVVERFLGVVHVVDTSALSLKSGIDEFFAKHGLSFARLRGQGYDGASNMRVEYNGLKALILKENPCARYVHCFAHQLQLVVVGCCEKNSQVGDFFDFLLKITNMVGASCKRRDELRKAQHEKMVKMLEYGEISSGRGLHQESNLTRPGSTRWGSHYTTIVRLLLLWSSINHVLENIIDDANDPKVQGVAASLGEKMESYQFIFIAHLMKLVLGYSNALSQMLQQKDQNIIAAMSLIHITKNKFQGLRDNGWDDLLQQVNSFCAKNDITILNMEDNVSSRFRSRQAGYAVSMTNLHHFRVNIFYQVVDQIAQEMENRFSESNTKLLTCAAALDPKNSFSNYSASKLVQLAELYPEDFSSHDRSALVEELAMWIDTMRKDATFSTVQDIGELAKSMVEGTYDRAFDLVYRLIQLVLVLPVATASVERAFSAMSLVKIDLRNRMGDEFLNDALVCCIEKEVFKSIDNEVILQHFQNMKTRKMLLPPLPL